jgi:glycerol kinase
MQRQADLLNLPIWRAATGEATALGAAFLAGLGVGFWSDLTVLRSLWQTQTVFQPALLPTQREEYLHQWRQAVALTLQWQT